MLVPEYELQDLREEVHPAPVVTHPDLKPLQETLEFNVAGASSQLNVIQGYT